MLIPGEKKLVIKLNEVEPPKKLHIRTANRKFFFHILQSVRELYDLDSSLFQLNGNVIIANFYQARLLADRMNEKRDTLRFPETAVKAGHINAMGLVDEILHYVLRLYKEQEAPDVFSTAVGYLENKFDPSGIDRLVETFRRLYPSPDPQQKAEKETVLEEIILLHLANINPAFEPYIELFDDTEIRETTVYSTVIEELETFFRGQPKFGPKNQNILDMLKAPMRANPGSLSDQLSYIRREWGMVLGNYLLRLLQGLDFIKEEERPFFSGPGPTRTYDFRGEDEELERFSSDREWMPKAVLLAKSTYVWLYQLSEKYGRPIDRLDQIPEEEIDLIASRGFTGLWLIGIWERSPASKRIKQICGNPEAEASAYSLMEYEISNDLGGWDALHALKRSCNRRGIRLASDMVPNHTGIDSKWVTNHPDWFIQLSYKPYPQYSYNGEKLGNDERVALFIEDHYYDKTDAAVTFKRLDTYTGNERFIYHGNDGTSMPWNDTAQLDFLNPEVREAVIQTILHVARNFSIIRFDAAMTLTKKHFQRLWYPEPGSGGDIPTRAEHGMSKEDFNRAMPVEFWREVVDRIAEEIPDTLLLAEAFWMMEGYFVRTLGMHRVYNSAFMNMLKNEENEKYRNTIKNTQEFDPDILKRFVNFMNNPDEDTAIAQFGTDDKYFGVCTLMVTMPGLPMFGHGQIVGYTEKYGMEYRKSYWNETENRELIERHEAEIFPLMKKRYLFAEVAEFLLYDVYTGSGQVNENVFAYSNRSGTEGSLVLYNNSFSQAEGWINISAPFAVKQEDGSKQIIQKHLAQGLGIPADGRCFVLFKEQRTDLWYIRNCKEIWDRGLYSSLRGYENHVFMDFQIVYDNEFGHYNQLATFLNGKGTPNIERSLQEVYLAPLHSLLTELLPENLIKDLYSTLTDYPESKSDRERLIEKIEEGYSGFYEEALLYLPAPKESAGVQAVRKRIRTWMEAYFTAGAALLQSTDSYIKSGLQSYPYTPYILMLIPFYRSLTGAEARNGIPEQLLLEKPAADILSGIVPPEDIENIVKITKLFTIFETDLTKYSMQKPGLLISSLFKHLEISRFLQENRYDSVLYFHKESFEKLLWFIVSLGGILDAYNGAALPAVQKAYKKSGRQAKAAAAAADKAGYQTELFIESCRNL